MDDRNLIKLTQRKKRLLEKLPPIESVLRGSLLTRYRKCGKPYCRCAKGEPHGPNYYVTIKQRDGSSTTIPVPTELRSVVRQYIANYRKFKKLIEEISTINAELLQKKLLKNT